MPDPRTPPRGSCACCRRRSSTDATAERSPARPRYPLLALRAAAQRRGQPVPREASAAAPAAPSAVAVRNVHKTFRLPHEQYMTLKERALHPFRSRTYDELHALQAVNLEIAAGEFFGIVGRNGSGKSTPSLHWHAIGYWRRRMRCSDSQR